MLKTLSQCFPTVFLRNTLRAITFLLQFLKEAKEAKFPWSFCPDICVHHALLFTPVTFKSNLEEAQGISKISRLSHISCKQAAGQRRPTDQSAHGQGFQHELISFSHTESKDNTTTGNQASELEPVTE